MSETKEPFKKVIGTLYVSIDLHCPNCDEYLDVFNDEQTSFCNDEGQAWNIITSFGREKGWENLNEELQCGSCKYDFIWDELEY